MYIWYRMIYLELEDLAGDKQLDLYGTFSIREIIDLIGDRLSDGDEEDDEEDSESEESIDVDEAIRNMRDRSAAMEEAMDLHRDLD
jgi:hypothetical protein